MGRKKKMGRPKRRYMGKAKEDAREVGAIMEYKVFDKSLQL